MCALSEDIRYMHPNCSQIVRCILFLSISPLHHTRVVSVEPFVPWLAVKSRYDHWLICFQIYRRVGWKWCTCHFLSTGRTYFPQSFKPTPHSHGSAYGCSKNSTSSHLTRRSASVADKTPEPTYCLVYHNQHVALLIEANMSLRTSYAK